MPLIVSLGMKTFLLLSLLTFGLLAAAPSVKTVTCKPIANGGDVNCLVTFTAPLVAADTLTFQFTDGSQAVIPVKQGVPSMALAVAPGRQVKSVLFHKHVTSAK